MSSKVHITIVSHIHAILLRNKVYTIRNKTLSLHCETTASGMDPRLHNVDPAVTPPTSPLTSFFTSTAAFALLPPVLATLSPPEANPSGTPLAGLPNLNPTAVCGPTQAPSTALQALPPATMRWMILYTCRSAYGKPVLGSVYFAGQPVTAHLGFEGGSGRASSLLRLSTRDR